MLKIKIQIIIMDSNILYLAQSKHLSKYLPYIKPSFFETLKERWGMFASNDAINIVLHLIWFLLIALLSFTKIFYYLLITFGVITLMVVTKWYILTKQAQNQDISDQDLIKYYKDKASYWKRALTQISMPIFLSNNLESINFASK